VGKIVPKGERRNGHDSCGKREGVH